MKTYSEQESAQILKIASKNSQEVVSEGMPGLTQDELEIAAKEAGIRPEEVRKAIDSIESGHSPRQSSFWGGPFAFSDEVMLDHEISPLEWETKLAVIREFFQSKGVVDVRDSVFEWSSPELSTNAAQITAINQDGKTRLSVRWSGPLTALPFYLPIPVVGIASLFFASEFLELGAVAGMTLVALSIIATFLVGRGALVRHMNSGFDKLRGLVQSLAKSDSKALEQPQELTQERETSMVAQSDSDLMSNVEIEEADYARVEQRARRTKA